MAISQSVLDNAATAFIATMLPKSPMDAVMAQAIGVQVKSGGIAVAGERGVDLVNASVEARAASSAWALDDPLKVAMENMLVTLMGATASFGKQASEMKLPK